MKQQYKDGAKCQILKLVTVCILIAFKSPKCLVPLRCFSEKTFSQHICVYLEFYIPIKIPEILFG
uniref:Uncharacterized protein n=1 Tax=Romanomermis culicivorax TaxID=13658 RepID=A0A915L6C8_ROMCU